MGDAIADKRLAILDDYQGYFATFNRGSEIRNLDVVVFRDHVDGEKLIQRLANFQFVLRIRERTAFPRFVLERLPNLRLVLATGMRNAGTIDLVATDELGITVCATGAHHQTTVELAWTFILAFFRRFREETASLRNGDWQLGVGQGLAGRTLGIAGLGNMGVPMAKIGRSFGMNVIAWSTNLTRERAARHSVLCVTKHELFACSDVVTVHMPLSKATVGIIGLPEIAAMKKDAYLINTSRAQLVQNEPLLAALQQQQIGGLGIDAFDVEPLPADHPYRTLSNVIATPHIGYVTRENYDLFIRESLENLVAFVNGRPIRTITSSKPFLEDSQVTLQGGRAC